MQNLDYCLPTTITPAQFLADYWQKKPLLIKNGLPQLAGMFEPDDIIELAQDEDATARLISEKDKQWSIKNSPLQPTDFQQLPKHWTVLVQNMEQWSPELANLWHAFDFIPQWQRDDIMVSYAPEGGSVGRHYDNYDVFLVQGYGSRRWQLGKMCDETTEFEKGQPIRIMDDMGALIFDEVLTAGDVLYVPTGLSHYGVAQDDCLTFSFGCRRPTPLQLLDNLADVATHEDTMTVPLKIVQPCTTAGKLSHASLADIKAQLITLLQSDLGDALLTQAISETVSKRQYELMLPEDYIEADDLITALTAGALLRQDLASRIIYTQSHDKTTLYINGTLLDKDTQDPNDLAMLVKLADGEAINLQQLQAAGVTIDTVCDWIENGWVLVDPCNLSL